MKITQEVYGNYGDANVSHLLGNHNEDLANTNYSNNKCPMSTLYVPNTVLNNIYALPCLMKSSQQPMK